MTLHHPMPCGCRSHKSKGRLFCPNKACWCHDVHLKNVLLLPKGADGVHRADWDAHGSAGRVFEAPGVGDQGTPFVSLDFGEPSGFVRGRRHADGRITIDEVV